MESPVRTKKKTELTTLGCFCIIPILFVASMIIVPLVDKLYVILVYGSDAFFQEGLRIVNSKQGIVSNGDKITGFWIFVRGIMVFIPMGIVFLVLHSCNLFVEQGDE